MRAKPPVSPEDLSGLKFYQLVSLFQQTKSFDVIIIGGSYAGLSAAMILGRALKSVLIIDSGNLWTTANAETIHLNSEDGEVLSKIVKKTKEQVLKYRKVKFLKDKIESVKKEKRKFIIQTKRTEKFTAKKILFATDVVDMMPGLPGFSECWSISVFHCPYCNGYEVADTDIGIIANGDVAYELIKLLYNWSKHLFLFTNGPQNLSNEQIKRIRQKNIIIIEDEIAGIDHKKGQVKAVILKNGDTHPVKAIFCKLPFLQATDIPQKQLGCELTEEGFIKTDIFQRTSVEGVYSAGDNAIMSRAISLAAATGSIAGMYMNKEIIEESSEF